MYKLVNWKTSDIKGWCMCSAITKRITKRKWWFNKTEYWIKFGYINIGPYKSYEAADKDRLRYGLNYDNTQR